MKKYLLMVQAWSTASKKILCWLTKENMNTALFIYGQDMKTKLLTGPLPGRIDAYFDFQRTQLQRDIIQLIIHKT